MSPSWSSSTKVFSVPRIALYMICTLLDKNIIINLCKAPVDCLLVIFES